MTYRESIEDFFKLPYSARLQIVEDLGVLEYHDPALTDFEVFMGCFQRINARGLQPELDAEVKHTKGRLAEWESARLESDGRPDEGRRGSNPLPSAFDSYVCRQCGNKFVPDILSCPTYQVRTLNGPDWSVEFCFPTCFNNWAKEYAKHV